MNILISVKEKENIGTIMNDKIVKLPWDRNLDQRKKSNLKNLA